LNFTSNKSLTPVWVAAFQSDKKLKKREVQDVDIGLAIEELLSDPSGVSSSLRLTSSALIGVSRLFLAKTVYHEAECIDMLHKLNQQYESRGDKDGEKRGRKDATSRQQEQDDEMRAIGGPDLGGPTQPFDGEDVFEDVPDQPNLPTPATRGGQRANIALADQANDNLLGGLDDMNMLPRNEFEDGGMGVDDIGGFEFGMGGDLDGLGDLDAAPAPRTPSPAPAAHADADADAAPAGEPEGGESPPAPDAGPVLDGASGGGGSGEGGGQEGIGGEGDNAMDIDIERPRGEAAAAAAAAQDLQDADVFGDVGEGAPSEAPPGSTAHRRSPAGRGEGDGELPPMSANQDGFQDMAPPDLDGADMYGGLDDSPPPLENEPEFWKDLGLDQDEEVDGDVVAEGGAAKQKQKGGGRDKPTKVDRHKPTKVDSTTMLTQAVTEDWIQNRDDILDRSYPPYPIDPDLMPPIPVHIHGLGKRLTRLLKRINAGQKRRLEGYIPSGGAAKEEPLDDEMDMKGAEDIDLGDFMPAGLEDLREHEDQEEPMQNGVEPEADGDAAAAAAAPPAPPGRNEEEMDGQPSDPEDHVGDGGGLADVLRQGPEGVLERRESEQQNSQQQNFIGYSRNTTKMMMYLKEMADKSKAKDGDLSFKKVCKGMNRETVARGFFELLVLRTKGFIDVKQEQPYADIKIKPLDRMYDAGEAEKEERAAEEAAHPVVGPELFPIGTPQHNNHTLRTTSRTGGSDRPL